MNLRRALLLSGIGYILIFISGFYANFSILETMVVPGNSELTVSNFVEHHSKLGWGILGFVVMLVFDVILVITLFHVTKKVSRNISAIASGFRLFHAIGFGMALMCLMEIYRITSHPSEVDISILENSVIYFLQRFDKIWTIGLLLFGIHLAILGYLSLISNFVPKRIGFLLLLSAIGYLVSCTAKLIMPNYVDYEQCFELLVIVFGVVGELSFAIWLLVKGIGQSRWFYGSGEV